MERYPDLIYGGTFLKSYRLVPGLKFAPGICASGWRKIQGYVSYDFWVGSRYADPSLTGVG